MRVDYKEASKQMIMKEKEEAFEAKHSKHEERPDESSGKEKGRK